MVEHWLPVVGFEDLYEVSDHGRVRALKTGKLKKLTPSSWGGYDSVLLWRSNKPKGFLVHRLVLAAFVGPPPPGTEGCHNDGTKTNNHVSNLRWDTHRENILDVERHGGSLGAINPARGEAHGNAIFTEEDIRVIRAEPKFHGVNAMLGRVFGVSRHTIGNIRKPLGWTHVHPTMVSR